jgi:hypothetical protein
LARVHSAKKNRGGKKTYTCGRCGNVIEPGEKYFFWEPRYGGKQIRCKDHYPRQSEMTTSKMSEVYAACEDAEDYAQAYAGSDAGDYMAQVTATAEKATEIADQYRDAAEHFGGAGENADRADELEGFASELESVDFPDFNDFWQNIPDENEEDALTAWREECTNILTSAVSEVP